jgi:hypothetical protein
MTARPNMARVLPATQPGRELLHEAARIIGGWGKPGGTDLEAFDWDTSAVEDKRLLDGQRRAR